ncbi:MULTISPECIES: hypothetical protein [Aliiglaciecola]|uniref:hypothetical protein n=1 Tax=Aliiglaciecola TaxID=1406885 RepID=UPI001C0A4DCC|nr:MULTISPECIES: hypothetical protein [Aliiglaciecola]MBU2878455.1 hypothetical protein [Aliiglaciecola lipolytica]MDO6712066.1 hypothetical protein [Aliiglaciecola sp. 2_MG-2023]MDO6753146.1 hypothetical protein [Aliiglaciecola sp. 1_MG-2023]
MNKVLELAYFIVLLFFLTEGRTLLVLALIFSYSAFLYFRDKVVLWLSVIFYVWFAILEILQVAEFPLINDDEYIFGIAFYLVLFIPLFIQIIRESKT